MTKRPMTVWTEVNGCLAQVVISVKVGKTTEDFRVAHVPPYGLCGTNREMLIDHITGAKQRSLESRRQTAKHFEQLAAQESLQLERWLRSTE